MKRPLRHGPMLLHEFVERELGFRNAVAKLQRTAVLSPGGLRLVLHPESWLRAEEVQVPPHRAYQASQAFRGKVLATLKDAVAGNDWVFTGWCLETRSEVRLGTGDFEHEQVLIPMNRVGRICQVKVTMRDPSREEMIIEAIEEICRIGHPRHAGWRKKDIRPRVAARFPGLGVGEFKDCWDAANIDKRYRDGGASIGSEPVQTE